MITEENLAGPGISRKLSGLNESSSTQSSFAYGMAKVYAAR